jgi:hypothetical protein
MAVSTTFMTGPLLNLIDFVWRKRGGEEAVLLPEGVQSPVNP